MNGNSPTIGASTGNSGAVITNSSTAASLTVNQSTRTTFGGTLQDDGGGQLSLSMSGTGRLTLSNTNTYSGATAVNGGTLDIGPTGSVASQTFNVGSARGVDR